MKIVPIAALPVQTLSIRLDDDFYDITVRLCAASSREAPFYRDGVIMMDIYRNQVAVVLGQRVVSDSTAIPYIYLQTGNFVWLVEDGDLLDYNQFGVTQFLIYLSAAELAVANASA